MLMNHNNFHFTQISDKTNDIIFLKSPKTVFLSHFLPFLVIFAREDFFQKIWLCHTQLYMAPQHHAKFKKKLMSQSQENLWTDKRTDGRTDGQTLFHRPFQPRLGVQKNVPQSVKV